jgi:hypothetical protein
MFFAFAACRILGTPGPRPGKNLSTAATQQANEESRRATLFFPFDLDRFFDDVDRVWARRESEKDEVAKDGGCDADQHGKLPEVEESNGRKQKGLVTWGAG